MGQLTGVNHRADDFIGGAVDSDDGKAGHGGEAGDSGTPYLTLRAVLRQWLRLPSPHSLMSSHLRPFLLCASVAFLAASCSVSPHTEGPSLGENPSALPLDYNAEIQNGQFFLGPEDRITLDVWQHTDLSRTYKVRNDGSVILPLVGKLHVGGETREQFEDQVTEAYGEYLVSPVLYVDVEFSPERKVTVLGEVNRTTVVTLLSPRTTVLDVIAQAGGIGEDGDRTGVLIARRVNGAMTVRHYDLEALFMPSDPNLRTDIPYVQSGDVVYVIHTWRSAYDDRLQTISDSLRALIFAENAILNGPRVSDALTGDIF